ncbi:UDP-3-O-(3-hydroxymyristoyl)glucosamine N-acyltransferase [Marinibactrum halimedae]|nr:UDP-3-O-(3-hydroxymyristoyl)glucosamine N-acyltransferase [Marinibactrum halimedae]MCD9457581.1 UDP-3-O-(3-hydroxymyristoyl)glucosamine N-acyltransferase [Marinibactrum halimedae]
MFVLKELSERIGAELIGDPQLSITGIATLQSASPSDISFLANPKYQKYLSNTNAGAVILSPKVADAFEGNRLICGDPYLAYAALTALFAEPYGGQEHCHPSAVVSDGAEIASTACVMANAVVEAGAVIGEGAVVGAGSVVGRRSIVGVNTCLAANVSVYHDVKIGENCIIHSGAVIGGDGFGFAPSGNGWVKIHQLGGVRIGNRVEIGANTTVDRGALDDTVLGDGVILDNMVQIGHSAELGENTAMAACSGVSGSTKVGANCTIAGGVGIAGHITIVDGVHITAMSMITKSILSPGSYSSGTPFNDTKSWRKNAVRFNQLDKISKRLSLLETQHKMTDAD